MRLTVIAAILGMAVGNAAQGAVVSDTSGLSVFLSQAKIGGAGSLGSFTYDAANDRAFVMTFGSTGALRVVDHVSGGEAAQGVDTYVSNAQWQLFLRDGDSTAGGQGIPSGILLNPKDIQLPGGGVIAAGTEAIVIDAATTPPKGVKFTERLYSYNLQKVVPNPDPQHVPTSPPYMDGRDVFHSLVTLSQLNLAAGLAETATSTSNAGRQFAWSGNGQAVYFNDSVSTFGGIWRVSAATGALTKVVDERATGTGAVLINTEPSVRWLNATTDRLFFRGSTTYGNVGGLNYADYTDGAGPATVSPLIMASELTSFLNTTSAMDISATAFAPTLADQPSDGDLYFWAKNSGTGSNQRQVLLRRDADGNLWKVLTYQERLDFAHANNVSSINANVLRIQTRETTLNGNPITQLLYAESSGGNYVAGAYVFKPADFSHNNIVNSGDVDAFRTVITTPASAQSNFDLNGDNVFTFFDLQLGLKGLDFGAADINLDGVVSYLDYDIFESHVYESTADITGFLSGDVNNDGVVDYGDYLILKDSFGHVSSVLPPSEPYEIGVLPPFAGVPEPASLGVLGLGALLMLRRRRGIR